MPRASIFPIRRSILTGWLAFVPGLHFLDLTSQLLVMLGAAMHMTGMRTHEAAAQKLAILHAVVAVLFMCVKNDHSEVFMI